MKKKRIQDAVSGLDKKSSRYANNPVELESLVQKASRKAGGNKRALDKVWEELLVLFRLLRAWANGSYKQIGWKSVILGISGLLYLLNPLDLFPDFLIGGLFDDATVLAFVFGLLKSEILAFKRWETKQEEFARESL